MTERSDICDAPHETGLCTTHQAPNAPQGMSCKCPKGMKFHALSCPYKPGELQGMNSQEETKPRPNMPHLKEQVEELHNQLQWLKKSAASGGLPDMHIENILKWYADSVEAEASRRERQARMDEQQQLIDSIDKNHADRYPDIVETDILTYVSHGHALACKQMKRNATVRIAKLKSQGDQQ